MRTTKPKKSARRPRRGVTHADVRKVALALPEAEEYRCYGTPGFRVKGKLFARLHEDGGTLVLKVPMLDRDFLLKAAPRLYHITDHYRDYPYVLLRLSEATVTVLRERLAEAWRAAAPKRLLSSLATDA